MLKPATLSHLTEACDNHGTQVSDVVSLAKCSYATSDTILQPPLQQLICYRTHSRMDNSVIFPNYMTCTTSQTNN